MIFKHILKIPKKKWELKNDELSITGVYISCMHEPIF